ncbi:helix-turn-helix domain-containing protein [Halomonas sp. BC04]
MRRAYQNRSYPALEQEQLMARTFGCVHCHAGLI